MGEMFMVVILTSSSSVQELALCAYPPTFAIIVSKLFSSYQVSRLRFATQEGSCSNKICIIMRACCNQLLWIIMVSKEP